MGDSTAKEKLRPPWFRCAKIVLIALNVLAFLIMILQGVPPFSPTWLAVDCGHS